MALHIECEEHYLAVKKFAEDNNCLDALNSRLTRLKDMCGADETCYLHADFAPLSFAFLITDGGRRRLVGGLIYSGPGQYLDGSGPAFTVSVEPHSNEHKWGIHT
jgi:hypothetical protein